jgi:Xaa-Pro aminopeptidase
MAEIQAAADTGWKGYSLAERDRRWNAVRANAAAERLDCVLVMKGNRIDARYLTQIMETGIILPADGRAPVVFNERGQGNDWVPEARKIRGRDRPQWGPIVADILMELGLERGRIGVAGMGPGTVTHARAADGVLNYASFAEVVRKLPDAAFIDATNVVGFARYVKSDAEIECLRRATAIAESAIEVMVECARSGVDQAVLYGRVTGRLMELGSEHYCRARTDWTSHGFALKTGPLGVEGTRFTDPPIGRRFEEGTFITNEVSSIWGAMVAQEVQPILVGKVPDDWKRAVDLQREVFDAGLKRMEPGLTYIEFVDYIQRSLPMPPGFKAAVTMHGRGAGDDGPLITGRSQNEKYRGLKMEKGNAWVWKPAIRSDDGKVDFQFGGTVALTERGAEALFCRQPGLVSTA